VPLDRSRSIPAAQAALNAMRAPQMRRRPTVAHLDADAFFASVEQHQRPSLRGRPVLVGGVGPRGVVATASYEARAFGARSAMPMEQARRLCPTATVVVPRFLAYSAYSAQIMAVLREVTDQVEAISIDEAFAELDHLPGSSADLETLAHELRARAHARTGLSVSLGLGRSKLVAKLASEAAKPGGVRVVDPADEDEFLLALPVRALWGVGPVSAARLDQLGVRTVEDLRAQPLDTLVMTAGEAAGANLYRVARGWDDRPVTTVRERKSAGAEHTFDDDLHGRTAIAAALDAVTDSALRRLERHAVAARTVVVKVRVASFTTITRSVTLSRPTSDVTALRQAAQRALALAEVVEPVRLLGVSFHGLSEHSQLMLPLGMDVGVHEAGPEGDGPFGGRRAGGDETEQIAVDDADAADHGSQSDGGDQDGAVVARSGPVRATAAALAPGLDVQTSRDGRGWVVHLGDDGRVAVRFETAATGPGYQRWVDPEVEELVLVDPLGPDGLELAAAAEPAETTEPAETREAPEE
jgi:DNA polymerase-4